MVVLQSPLQQLCLEPAHCCLELANIKHPEEGWMAGNGKKVKAGVHAHEKKMHPGRTLTTMPKSVTGGNGKGKESKKK